MTVPSHPDYLQQSVEERAQFMLANPDVLHSPGQMRKIVKELLDKNKAYAKQLGGKTIFKP